MKFVIALFAPPHSPAARRALRFAEAAGLRRGVLDAGEAQRYQRPAANLAAGWELSGLGQLHEAAQQADRLVCFGGQ